ncbi:unnamed protein product [Camellia sinensis]
MNWVHLHFEKNDDLWHENGDLGVAGAPKLQRFSGGTPVNPNFEEDDVKLRLKGEDVQVGAMEEREEQDQICFQITVPCDSEVTLVGGDSLTISVVPADVGKATARLEKARIQDGNCYWENPVYETVKFFRDPKRGKFHEKIYNFVVSNGSSKSGFVGEVSIDFASYAEAIKLSSVSLPLKNAKSDAVLHVSIQRMQENIDQSFRETEAVEDTRHNSKDRSLRMQLSISDADGSIKSNFTEDGPFNKRISHIAELNGNHRASSGSDLTMSSSESSSDLDTPRGFGLENNNVHHESVLQKTTSDLSTTIHEQHQGSQWEWLEEKSEEASDVVIEKLKTELIALSRQAEVSELELQTLRKQTVKESKRGHDLFKEVLSVKEERDFLKEECERFKAFQKRMDEAKVKNKLPYEGGDPHVLLEELRQELNYEKDLNANLRIQLEKTQESNSELILAVRDLDEMLEQKNRETLNIYNRSATGENAEELAELLEMEDDEEQKALEELVKEHSDPKEACALEQKITDLYSELEMYRRDKDELEVQVEQLALDYEILKQENHDLSYKLEQSQLQEQLKMQYECSSSYATINELENQIENLESELQQQSSKFSDSLATVTKLEIHVKSLEEEIEKQARGFEADLEILTCAKVEQEQRAIRSEEALRKMHWQNKNTAERLQEEFKRLSVQMTSTFEANEKLATKAMAEASELRLQKSHLEELVRKAKEELESVQDQYEATLHKLSSQLSLKVNQIEQMESKIEDKSKQIKRGEESHRILSQETIILRAEIQRLKTENDNISVDVEEREILKGELEKMNTLMKKTEMLLQRGNEERNDMESTISLLRNEAEKSIEELNILRNLTCEKESIIGNMQLELETLKSQYNELKRSLFEDESEKEKLMKRVIQLKGDLKKKDDAISGLEKKLKDSNNRSTALDGTKPSLRNNRSASVPRGPKETANLKDKIKQLEGQIKLTEAALETSANSFLEKEKDLQDKIEELERRLEELCQNSASFYEYQFQKFFLLSNTEGNGSSWMQVAEVSEAIPSNGCIHEEVKTMDENLRRDQENLKELLNEMALLKERNKSMEGELKEMQERYSEISLKFAEVEGERQQLVMTVRNLKNAKKS